MSAQPTATVHAEHRPARLQSGVNTGRVSLKRRPASWRTDMIPDYVTRLRAEIERREQSKRYCDAAEGQRLLGRQDNERSLDNAYGRLEAALCPPEQVVGELGGGG